MIRFSLIVCTYMRPRPLLDLLNSVKIQSVYPTEVLIVDGSVNDETDKLLHENKFENLKYFKVEEKNRGLTKQRNYGINLASETSEIICFLDDDIVLKDNYFENLLKTYEIQKDALAVGGYIDNNNTWKKESVEKSKNNFYFDGWMRSEPSRFKLRRLFGLQPDKIPGFLPTFAHGRSVGFLPPSGKIYEVEQIMGGVSSYKKEVFDSLKFSTYFDGYGLYEDADFSLRLSEIGKLYVNTSAQLYHYHDDSGRPNKYKYGKMVVRNGWYVWRVKYPKPTFKMRFKWNATVFLLIAIRFANVFTSNKNKRKEAFTESLGRVVGWYSLIFNKPRVKK
ncbi:glycosyltransferase family 2 protein [Flavivirga amylovorans]|uniref:Glycosyltransferase family 2 protein n=1 Tax=Flavivirga amylovorans TaxID=870486 RepID=A0ABT8WYH1_9FLAO|nr:glycosyltransferase family 2 protein [Flavivirga amylovorans]MDO5986395.1 glycosyltransferase family 2 protein [Flavivirga amylovorans]